MEATQQAEDAWVQTIIDLSGTSNAVPRERARPATTTTRATRRGVSRQNGWYGGGSIGFIQLLEAWRDKGTLEGLELTRA